MPAPRSPMLLDPSPSAEALHESLVEAVRYLAWPLPKAGAELGVGRTPLKRRLVALAEWTQVPGQGRGTILAGLIAHRLIRPAMPWVGSQQVLSWRAGFCDFVVDLDEAEVSLRWEQLRTRQCEVLAGMAAAATNGSIGRLLGLSEDTVKCHVKTVLDQLGAQNRVEAVALAFDQGLLNVRIVPVRGPAGPVTGQP